MTTRPHYIFARGGDLSLIVDGVPFNVANDNPQYESLVQSIKDKDWAKVVDFTKVSEEFTRIVAAFGNVVVYGGHVTYEGKEMHGYLVSKILEAASLGLPIEPLGRFMENVLMNPDTRAQSDLYNWCEAGKMPITEDGYIIGYKVIRENYNDHHSNSFDNHPGKIVEMPREDCDPDPNRTCSTGLHFCAAAYLGNYGYNTGRVVLVKVHPRDVVAFPTDYNLQKARGCRHEVVEEISKETAKTFFTGFQGYYIPPAPKFTEGQRVWHNDVSGIVSNEADGSMIKVGSEWVAAEFLQTDQEYAEAGGYTIYDDGLSDTIPFIAVLNPDRNSDITSAGGWSSDYVATKAEAWVQAADHLAEWQDAKARCIAAGIVVDVADHDSEHEAWLDSVELIPAQVAVPEPIVVEASGLVVIQRVSDGFYYRGPNRGITSQISEAGAYTIEDARDVITSAARGGVSLTTVSIPKSVEPDLNFGDRLGRAEKYLGMTYDPVAQDGRLQALERALGLPLQGIPVGDWRTRLAAIDKVLGL